MHFKTCLYFQSDTEAFGFWSHRASFPFPALKPVPTAYYVQEPKFSI